jgi:hypothetical protein
MAMSPTPRRASVAVRARRWSATAALAVAVAVGLPAAASGAAAPTVQVSAAPIAKPLSTRAARATVVVRNAGKHRVSGLTLSVAARKGVKVTVTGAKRGTLRRGLKPVKAGKATRVGLRVRRTRTGPKTGQLTLRVLRQGKTVAKGRLSFGAPPVVKPTPPPAPPPAANPNTLAGRYFWGSLYTLNGIEQHTLYFTGPDLVFTGATDNGWPSCAAATETCRPYSFNAATGQLTIDGKPATLQGRQLTLDGNSYGELGFPPAGSRWDTRVTYSNSSGLCPMYCNYYTENLTFRPDGTFIRDAVSSGTGPVVDWAAIPPGSKGTYEVRPDRLLRLVFADGTERMETVGLYVDDAGALKPVGDGLVLAGDGYFDIRD